MILLNNFDPFTDFWSTNPQLRILFREEFEASTPSEVMWALFLYSHPESKFFNESPSSRKALIESDYLFAPLPLEDYSSTLQKIETHVLTKAQRSLMR